MKLCIEKCGEMQVRNFNLISTWSRGFAFINAFLVTHKVECPSTRRQFSVYYARFILLELASNTLDRESWLKLPIIWLLSILSAFGGFIRRRERADKIKIVLDFIFALTKTTCFNQKIFSISAETTEFITFIWRSHERRRKISRFSEYSRTTFSTTTSRLRQRSWWVIIILQHFNFSKKGDVSK
jgi:hypothetical protein